MKSSRCSLSGGLVLFLFAAGSPSQFPLLARVEEEIPPSPAQVFAWADFDADGDVDLFNWLGVFLNDGHARFSRSPSPQPTLALTASPAPNLGDLDGDGLLDIATGNSLFRNVGGGVMAPYPYPLPVLPASLFGAVSSYSDRSVLVDVDGDGDLDLFLVTASYAPHAAPGPITLWINNGAGIFASAQAQLPALSILAAGVIASDFDADSDVDILLLALSTYAPAGAGPGRILLRNNGAGFFSQAPGTIGSGLPGRVLALGEFNGDGIQDLVIGTGGYSNFADEIVLGTMAGFGPGLVTPRPTPAWTYVAIDVDGDGADELVRSSFGRIELHAVAAGGVGAASLQSFGASYALPLPEFRPRDLDGDGDPDLIIKRAYGSSVLLNSGVGALYEPPHALPTGVTFQGLGGDVDGDGHYDLIHNTTMAGGLNSTPQAILNDGFGRFAVVPSFAAPQSSISGALRFRAFDADGDGRVDLWNMTGSSGPYPASGSDVFYRNTGAGWVQAGVVSGTSFAPNVESGDLDGDGDFDLVKGCWDPGTTVVPIIPGHVIFNLGTAGFSAPVPLASAHAAVDFVLADIDRDLDLDLLQAATGAETCRLYLNSGNGTFVESTSLPGLQASHVTAGDLDGDGDQDVLFDSQVLINLGAGGFMVAPSLPAPVLGSMTLADIDGDGDLDLVESGGQLFRNYGNGAFNPPETFGSPTYMASLGSDRPKVVDLDQDGDLDVVTIGSGIVANLSRHLVRGSLARLGHPASLEIYGPPLSSFGLFASSTIEPFTYPPFGTVFLGLQSLTEVVRGTLPASGPTILTFAMPQTPAWVGQSVCWQAFVASATVGLTNLHVTTVVNP